MKTVTIQLTDRAHGILASQAEADECSIQEVVLAALGEYLSEDLSSEEADPEEPG